MINITKRTEPSLLITYRAKESTGRKCLRKNAYKDMDKKTRKQLKDYLLKEQGYICCYCMAEITFDDMRVEHWLDQSTNLNEQLTYNNLLAACHGNDKIDPNNKHCDAQKADKELKFNPSNKDHDMNRLIKYKLSSGQIYSEDIEFNEQIGNTEKKENEKDKSVLNLNFVLLKNNRIGVWKGIIEGWKKLKGKSKDKSFFEKQIKSWTKNPSDSYQKPYSGVALFYLNQKLRQAN